MAATVFRNGTLFDGHRYAGPAELLVHDGRVAAVATGGEHLEAPQGAQEVDLAGGLLAPGFVDAHVHAVQGGLERTRCDLSELSTREEYLAAVRRYADAHPERPWILGGGWAMAAFPGGTPLAADLDAVVPDRPVLLPNRDHHGAWVNTRALELAGITRDTPDPPHGHLERDADGQPDGHPPRGRDGAGVAAAAGGHRGRARRGPRRRPVLPARAAGSPAGRTRSSAPTPGWTTPGRRTGAPPSAAR